ncbi:hypothetical protein EB796_010963 [Bugula neritina]|uniref:Huntingtin n=1 Tax=Bugula neritina TaxID=10212 RepID=A0A7J7JWE8_BUGNE|nr:hypothetical protein EB796_010963 [Bugula neritina]
MPAVLKSGSTVDKNTVGAYIRLFEPLVIKALKMYTMNCSVYLQTQVLSLLVQLIQLRVNYCLLDNDGLLLLLSYEKLHSKTLITVPTIIQLCDGVMASGQNPTTHAIPALEMLVKDLFLCRSLNTSGNSDTVFHDIETQREVTASMLLRLIHHTKVLELLSLVLYQLMKDNEEKWKKLSRQIIDLLFPLISKQKIELESRGAMFSLQGILLAVSPSVYRPVDMLLKTLFTQPEHLGSRAMQERWLSSVLALFRVLLSIGKEEVILSRLNELEISFDRSLLSNSFMASGSFYSSTDEFTSTFRQMSESSESVISSSCGSVLPQELLASFLTQIVGFCAERLYADLSCPYLSKSDYEFSLQQLTLLLLYTSYMLQSGHFRKVAKFMTEQLKVKGSHLHQLVLEINDQIILVGKHYPTLTLQWSYILMLLNYDSHSWWEGVLRTPKDSDEDTELGVSPLLTLHERIIKCTGLAMYCDYVVENMHDAQHLTWLTVNHVNDIIDQLHESPVSDFMSTVFGNSSASGLFISAIQSRYNMNSTPTKLYNVVSCLRNMHNEQSGAVTMLLIEKMMSSSHSGISRLCDSVACRRLEVLLSEDEQTVHKQLMAEDVLKMMVTLHNSKRTHRRLLSLVDKLRATFYPTALSPISLTQADIQSAQQNMADKDFYLLVTKSVCSDNRNSPKLCASLLGSLGLKDILAIMSGESFQLSCLAECIKHGADKSVRADTGTVVNIAHRVESESNQRISPLLAACETMLKQIWIKFAPTAETDATQNSMEDSTVYSQPVISVDVVNAISVYLMHCPLFLSRLQQSDILAICHIAVSYFERVKLSADHPLQSSQMMFSWTSHAEEGPGDMAPVDICQLYAHLSLLCHVFKHPQFTSVFASNPSHVFTVIDSLTYILNNLNVPGLTPELENYRETLAISQDGYIQISQLVTCLSDIILAGKAGLPSSLVFLLNNVIRGLARLPSVNEHARMPVTAFLMSSETREDNNKPQLKVDALQDTVVLRDFIKRNNLLGWISRPQFEETWACLLHLLSPVAVTGNVDIAEEDDVENIEWMVSALRGITGLLCQTLNRAQPGNPLCTCYKNSHRHKPIASLLSSTRKVSRCECMKEVDLFCVNTERVSCDIGYNQLSIGHLTTQMSTFSPLISSIEKADVESAEKSQPIKSLQGVDTASCLKLLIDVYSHLLSPSATPKTPLMLLNECAKSIVMLSDLFYEKSQFAWMFSTLYDLYLNHHAEDELMNQYVVLGLCKAAAIHLDSNMEEKLCKLLEQSFRSIHIPTRLAAISGILYLLEAAPEGDLVKSLLNFLVDFISRSMDLINNKLVALQCFHFASLMADMVEN